MHVSFYNYKRMNDFLRQDIRREFEKLFFLDSDKKVFQYMYTNERKIGRVLGPGYSIGTESGTAALQFALTSLGVRQNDEVITVSNTNVSTLHSISALGAIPTLVDVKEDTMLMDIGLLEEAITERTRAIIPVHLYGQMVDMRSIQKIARKHGLFVVEDACQSHLARYAGERPGTRSDAVAYSFFLNKRFSGFGGGLVTTKRRFVYKQIEFMRNPFYHTPTVLKSLRSPSYLNALDISTIFAKLRHMDKWMQSCRSVAKRYYEGLSSTPLILPGVDPKAHHTFLFFTVRDKNRNRLRRYLRWRGIESVIWYPDPNHLYEPYKRLGYPEGSLPITERICATRLCLPINTFLTDDEVDYVIKTVKGFYRSSFF